MINEVGTEERELLRRANQGDRGAFGLLVGLHQARLRAYVARFVANPDDVCDIVQDVFLEAYRNLHKFDSNREFGPWLRGICRNRTLNFLRAARTRRCDRLAFLDESVEAKLIAASLEPDDTLEKIEVLKHCLSELKQDHRLLIQLRYWSGLAVNHIASRFNQTPASISMLLFRIKSVLMKCMERNSASGM